MASLLFRLGRFSFRHKWWVIATWLLALVVVAGLVGALKPKFAQDFDLPGTDSGTATSQLQQYFPKVMEQQSRGSATVVVYADNGSRRTPSSSTHSPQTCRSCPTSPTPRPSSAHSSPPRRNRRWPRRSSATTAMSV